MAVSTVTVMVMIFLLDAYIKMARVFERQWESKNISRIF